MMTKQNFEAIAAVLNSNLADLSIVLDFADMCEQDNPRFDRIRFVKAATSLSVDMAEYQVRAIRKQRGE
jgi:hypothetical protein